MKFTNSLIIFSLEVDRFKCSLTNFCNHLLFPPPYKFYLVFQLVLGDQISLIWFWSIFVHEFLQLMGFSELKHCYSIPFFSNPKDPIQLVIKYFTGSTNCFTYSFTIRAFSGTSSLLKNYSSLSKLSLPFWTLPILCILAFDY